MPGIEVRERLVEDLTRLTKSRKLFWDETADENAFRVVLNSATVVLSSNGDYTWLAIIDQEGKGLKRYRLKDNDLYELVRGATRNVDAKLNALLQELESK